MLGYLKISKSTYFYNIKHMNEKDKDAIIKQQITDIYNENLGRYGYRRITLVIRKRTKVNHKRVARIMHELGLYGIQPRAKYKSYKGEVGKVCKNLLLDKEVDENKHRTKYIQNFTTTGINQKWTTDVSEFHIAAGKLYLSPILDMNNGEIISFDISTHPDFKQTMNMLKQAFKKHSNLKGLIFHSDQGWQYQMAAYRKLLESKGIRQSMSRKGNCLDNGIMENFFGIMKNEMFYGHEYEFTSLEQLKEAMIKYIDYYNNKRIKEKLKGMTPIEYRNHSSKSVILN